MTGKPFRVEGTVRAAGLAIYGHVVDPARPGEALVVDLLLDGLPYAVARADRYDAALAAAGAPDPLHGFLFVLPQAVFEAVETAEVRLANTGIPVAPALRLPMEHRSVASALGPGHVAWLGGLRFSGWLPPDAPADLAVRGLIDGNKVAETRPEGWVTIDHDGTELAVRAFSLTLPRRFADGRAHHVEVVTGAGRTLTPVPLAFVAFPDGLAAFLAAQADVAAEQVRGALYDRLMPQSLPFADVAAWRARFDGDGDRLSRPVTVVLVGDADPATSLRSLEAQGGGWTAGRIPLGARATFAAKTLVDFLEGPGAAGEVVVFARAGAVFQPGALERLATALLADVAATCAYADILLETAVGPVLPLAHPAFDWERAVEGGYAASLFALRPAAALAAAREGADSLQKLFLLACRSAGVAPLHVPGFAARMPAPAPGDVQALVEAARGLAATFAAGIEPLAAVGDEPAIRLRRRPAACRVTAIVPFRDEVFALPRCLAALRAQASRPRARHRRRGPGWDRPGRRGRTRRGGNGRRHHSSHSRPAQRRARAECRRIGRRRGSPPVRRPPRGAGCRGSGGTDRPLCRPVGRRGGRPASRPHRGHPRCWAGAALQRRGDPLLPGCQRR